MKTKAAVLYFIIFLAHSSESAYLKDSHSGVADGNETSNSLVGAAVTATGGQSTVSLNTSGGAYSSVVGNSGTGTGNGLISASGSAALNATGQEISSNVTIVTSGNANSSADLESGTESPTTEIPDANNDAIEIDGVGHGVITSAVTINGSAVAGTSSGLTASVNLDANASSMYYGYQSVNLDPHGNGNILQSQAGDVSAISSANFQGHGSQVSVNATHVNIGNGGFNGTILQDL